MKQGMLDGDMTYEEFEECINSWTDLKDVEEERERLLREDRKTKRVAQRNDFDMKKTGAV